MATISTFQPAQTSQGQEYFKLPLNEMYKVLSDTQISSDLIRAEADAISEESFYNLPKDDAKASEARKWLIDSVDGLTESYGEDPRKWSSGVQSLKKQVRRRFDPASGDIGRMQKRYERVISLGADIDERHKDYPELASYLKSQIQVDDFEASTSNVDYGVRAGAEVRNVPQKEVTDFFTKNMAHLEEKTLEHFSMSQYKTIDEFTTAWKSGKITGITPQDIFTYLYSITPEEYYNSYYQKAKAAGDPNAEQELVLFERDANGKVNYENGMMGLNPESTIAQTIFGYSQAKSYTKEDFKINMVKDALALDVAKRKTAVAEENSKTPFVGVTTAGETIEQLSPWGNTEGSVNTYINDLEGYNNDITKGILTDLGISPTIINDIDADGLYKGISAGRGGDTKIKIKGKTGNDYEVELSPGTIGEFKGIYEYNWANQEKAKADLTQAAARARAYMLDKYGEDVQQPLAEKIAALPEIEGYSKEAAMELVRQEKGREEAERLTRSLFPFLINVIPLPHKKTADTEAYSEFSKKVSSEELKAYEKIITEDGALLSEYNDKLSEDLAVNVAFTSILTNDYGLDPVSQVAFQKQLEDTFAYGNTTNMLGYVSSQKEKQTFQALLNQAEKVHGQTTAGKLVSVGRLTTPTPDGTHHWQATYMITNNESKQYTMSVVFPDNAMAGGAGFPQLEAITQSAHGRASDIISTAKMFGLHEFTIPTMPHIQLRWDPNDDRVMVNVPGQPVQRLSSKEGQERIAWEYMIQDIMLAYGDDYEGATIRYMQMVNGAPPTKEDPNNPYAVGPQK